jgi:myo-inositol catabolism protein IolC
MVREMDRALLLEVIASRRPDLDDPRRGNLVARLIELIDALPAVACTASDYWLG